MSDGGIVTVALHPALLDPFRQWLDKRGLDLCQVSNGDDPFWVVSPRVLPSDVEPEPEVVTCPDCTLDLDGSHADGCPRIHTCGQFGPPWLPLEECHREPTPWTMEWWTQHMIERHG